MNQVIQPLKKGDKIAIVSPAKAIEIEHVEFAKQFFENAGYVVVIGKHALGRNNYFSGTDLERAGDFQEALDDPTIKAIICARGGYGAVRILDQIQWASQLLNPKWIVGFSDITVFHQRLQRFDIKSIHGTMPLNFKSNTRESLATMLQALEGKPYTITTPVHGKNKLGFANGKIVGGNLSILYSLLGTDDQIDFSDCILFIEDVGEQLYAIDRMLFALKKASVFDKISGLIVGGFTDLKDTETPTGFVLEDIILDHFTYSKIPICFQFPVGHQDDNQAMICGEIATLQVTENETSLIFGNLTT